MGHTFYDHLHNLQAVCSTAFKMVAWSWNLQNAPFSDDSLVPWPHNFGRRGCCRPSKDREVESWPAPTFNILQEVQQFPGFASYYRHFLHVFTQVAKPLYWLMECTKAFHWTTDWQNTFEELWHCLPLAPVLTHPDFTQTFILDTNASNTGIEAVLSLMSGEYLSKSAKANGP